MWAGRGPGVASPVVLTCTTPAAGKLLAPYKYAALQKLDDPNEICAHEAVPSPPVLQAEHVREVVGLPGARAPFRRRGKALGAGRGLPPVTQRPSAQARTCAQLLALVAPRVHCAHGALPAELPGGPGHLCPAGPAELRLRHAVRVLAPVQPGRPARQPLAGPRPLL